MTRGKKENFYRGKKQRLCLMVVEEAATHLTRREGDPLNGSIGSEKWGLAWP